LGCLVGGGAWAAQFLALLLLAAIGPSELWGVQALVALLGIPAVGFLVSIVATVRRPTRRFGQGMLLGLTMGLLVAVVLAVMAYEPGT
jgi:hypothetical protein